MQGIGYILIGEEKIKVLWRTDLKTAVWFKIRKAGKGGNFFSDESEYLSNAPETLARLKAGKVICL